MFLSLFKTSQHRIFVLVSIGFHWIVVDLLEAALLRKTNFFFLSSQLPTASHLDVGSHAHVSSPCQGFVWIEVAQVLWLML